MAEPVYFQHFEVERLADGNLRELGRGAMGITYKAFDTNLHAPVALKIINSALTDDPKARERFLREARAAARLRHPNVATVLHLGWDGDACFYAMEFIEGETLEAYVARQGPLQTAQALEITMQTARALGAAQSEGLVHRDIKPANIMLARHRGEEDDEGVHVKVIDFGLAKFIEKGRFSADSGTLSLTMAGSFVGSPYYASPEQIEEGDIDIRSDIYSLGVTLWYLLTGKPPFTGSLGQIMAQHLQRVPPIEDMERRGVPPPVCALLNRMLAKQREDRHTDPAALRRELAECQRALLSGTGLTGGVASGATAAAIPSGGTGTTPPPAGDLIANRYRIVADLGEWDLGRLFKAEDQRAGGRIVAVWKLYPDLLADPAHAAEVGYAVTLVQTAALPGLVFIHGLERLPGGDYLITEWLDGFELSELLRARGQLKAPEAFTLLQKIASTVDDAADAGLEKLNLSLQSIKFAFPGGLPLGNAGQALVREPLKSWPPFELKIHLPEMRPLTSAKQRTSSGNERTLLPQRSDPGLGRRPVEGRAGMVWSLAEIVYELLGGTLPPAGIPRYPPLTELSEKANAVLRKALLAGAEPGFTGARQFALALFAAASTDSSVANPRPLPPPQPRPSLPPGAASSLHEGSQTLPPPLIAPPPLPGNPASQTPPKKRRRWWVFGLIALGVFLVIGAVSHRDDDEKSPDKDLKSTLDRVRHIKEDVLKDVPKANPVDVKRALPVETPTPPPPTRIPTRVPPPPVDDSWRPPPPPPTDGTAPLIQNGGAPLVQPNFPPPQPPRLIYPVRPLAVYHARLSNRDHFSSQGTKLTEIADILRQDRANFHRWNLRDPEDESDPFFADARNRNFFDSLTFRGAREAFVDGQPLVEVAILPGNRVIATILSK